MDKDTNPFGSKKSKTARTPVPKVKPKTPRKPKQEEASPGRGRHHSAPLPGQRTLRSGGTTPQSGYQTPNSGRNTPDLSFYTPNPNPNQAPRPQIAPPRNILPQGVLPPNLILHPRFIAPQIPVQVVHQEVGENAELDQDGNPEEQDPVMAQPPTAGQISATLPYDGSTNIDIFLQHVKRNQLAFDWTDDQVTYVTKMKLVGEAAIWLTGAERRRVPLDTLEHLEAALKLRFKATSNVFAAAKALHSIKQREGESVSKLFDRVLLAVDLKNHRWTEAQKRTDLYNRTLMEDTFIFFSSALRDDIRMAATNGSNPPDTAEALLTCAVAVEMQMELKKVEAAESSTNAVTLEEKVTQEVTVDVNAAQGRGKQQQRSSQRGQSQRGRGRSSSNADVTCYNCGYQGHYSYDCRQPRRQQGGRGRGQSQYQQGSSQQRGRSSRGSAPRGRRGGHSGYHNEVDYGYENDFTEEEYYDETQEYHQECNQIQHLNW